VDKDYYHRIEVVTAVFLDWCRQKLGIPNSVFHRLDTDDDWTVVIKAHAGIEAALNRLILNNLKDERLANIVGHMQTGDRDEGKMAFVKALDLLPSEIVRFITMLSRLRNKLVHNIKNVDFSFDVWVSEMDSSQIKQLRETLGGLSTGSLTPSRLTADDIRGQPRKLILSGCLIVMIRILKQEFAPNDPDWPDISRHTLPEPYQFPPKE
jgi:hypothetical protein